MWFLVTNCIRELAILRYLAFAYLYFSGRYCLFIYRNLFFAYRDTKLFALGDWLPCFCGGSIFSKRTAFDHDLFACHWNINSLLLGNDLFPNTYLTDLSWLLIRFQMFGVQAHLLRFR